MLHAFRESVGKYVAIAILALIGITFVFFGIDFSVTQSPFAAKVNGNDIPMQSFERELQRYQNQYQELYRVELTDELRRELRRTVVDQMVLREALMQHALDAGYYVSDERLAESIRSTEAFQVGNQFSPDTYRALLQANGMSPAQYEAQQRDALVLAEFQEGLAASTFLTPNEFRRYIELTNQRREVAFARFDTAAFLESAEIDDAEIVSYYEANPSRFMTPETVDIEYVDLTLQSIADTIEISEDDLRDYYDEVQERFQTSEERSVSHILITVDDDDYAAAEAEAEAALERARAGEDFAELAAELSDDGGTRNAGGSLGWIGRDVLPGPFEETLFSMDVGEIAGPVETEFGYHVLKLDEVRQAEVQTFEAARDELREELSTDRANSLFYERANDLRQAAFDAYDSLAPVAESQGLELETVDGFERGGRPDLFPNGGDVVARVFSEAAIVSGRNSDLIELSDDHVLVVRVRAHHDPEQRPLDDVRDEIAAELRLQSAQALAAEAAAAFLEAWADRSDDPAVLAAELGGEWTAARWVGRADMETPQEVLAAAFSQPRATVAGAVTREVPLRSGDAAVVVVTAVEAGDPADIAVAERDQRQRLLAEQAAQLEVAAYAANVRDDATVRVPDEVLNPQF